VAFSDELDPQLRNGRGSSPFPDARKIAGGMNVSSSGHVGCSTHLFNELGGVVLAVVALGDFGVARRGRRGVHQLVVLVHDLILDDLFQDVLEGDDPDVGLPARAAGALLRGLASLAARAGQGRLLPAACARLLGREALLGPEFGPLRACDYEQVQPRREARLVRLPEGRRVRDLITKRTRTQRRKLARTQVRHEKNAGGRENVPKRLMA